MLDTHVTEFNVTVTMEMFELLKDIYIYSQIWIIKQVQC